MLILTRRPGDSVFIEPHPDAHPSGLPEWFTRPIEVRILRVEGRHVRIGIEAAEGLRIKTRVRSQFSLILGKIGI